MDEKKSPQHIVHEYLKAIEKRDFEHARLFLSDTQFSYQSPIARFDDADKFIADATLIGTIIERVERRKTFVDGNEVCDILNFVVRISEQIITPVVQWTKVENNRIVFIESFFDAYEYKRMFDDDSCGFSEGI